MLRVGDLLLFVNNIEGGLRCDVGGFVAVKPLHTQPNETAPDSDSETEEEATEEGDDEDSDESTRSTSTVMCNVCGRG